MKEFFITKKDIKSVLIDMSDYKIDNIWREFRIDYESKGKKLFDRSTVPTDAFCKYIGIGKEDLLNVIKKGDNEWHQELLLQPSSVERL